MPRRARPSAVVVCASSAMVLLAACRAPESARPQAMTDSGQFAALQGTRWQSATLPDGSKPVPGLEIWWEVEDLRLTTSRGCVEMSGPVQVVGGRLVADSLVTPAVGCDPVVDRQARQWTDLLTSGPQILVDLGARPPAVVLDNGSHRMTFTSAAIPTDSLATG